jgi:putative FmdB family regulatory protein
MTYTYCCPNCGEFDVHLFINEERPTNCKKCGRELHRVFKTNVNLNFKNSYNSTRNNKWKKE